MCADEEKQDKGSQWDHVVLDVESQAVISMVCGKRTKENTDQLISDLLQFLLRSSLVADKDGSRNVYPSESHDGVGRDFSYIKRFSS